MKNLWDRYFSRGVSVGLSLWLLGALCSASLAELTISPERVSLNNTFARRQLLVTRDNHDVTRAVNYTSRDEQIASVDAAGYVTPHQDGQTEIVAQWEGKSVAVAVEVTGVRAGRDVDFATEIVPLLSRFGCNSGGCHGKQGGQNGFQLSLFGFDQTYDHDALVKQGRGRRVFPAAPDQSLLLLKVTGRMPHGGGQRMARGDQPYQLLRQWIENGAPPASPDAPSVVQLHVTPRDRVLSRDDHQQLAIVAEYSDGALRDVTRQAGFASNLDPVAVVDEDGHVQTVGESGEATIMARYMGHVGVFRAIVPHGEPLAEIPNFTPANYVDRLAAEKWKKLGLLPSAPCDDATFLRRVTVDVCGRLPTPDETRKFLADTSSNRRAVLIDRLLDSPDYPAFFAMQWGGDRFPFVGTMIAS